MCVYNKNTKFDILYIKKVKEIDISKFAFTLLIVQEQLLNKLKIELEDNYVNMNHAITQIKAYKYYYII